MYLPFYGLSEPPFELAFNPKFLFQPARVVEVLSQLESELLSARPLTLLLGDAGTGKTTLLRTLRQSDRCRHVRFVNFRNAPLTREEFVDTLAAKLELNADAASSGSALIQELQSALAGRQARGQSTALVLDEAETLSDELLEEVCLLASVKSANVRLLPLVLAGQSALELRLAEPGLRQLRQRVSLRVELGPLDLSQTAAYIAWHVHAAGSQAGRLFTREAVMLIHALSKGVPRTINVVCDNALLSGFAREVRPVTRDVVREVWQHLDLGATTHATATTLSVPERSGPDSPASVSLPAPRTVAGVRR